MSGLNPGIARPTTRSDRFSDLPRRVAYETLAAVHRDDAYANLVLPRLISDNRLTGRDAALATELAYGTLRMRGQIDAILARAADRPVERIDPLVRDALRLGAYQMLHTRIPGYAAVKSTVDLVRVLAPAAAGFANAVLRRVSEAELTGWLAKLAATEAEDSVAQLALTQSHPEWIVRGFAEALGEDVRGEMPETRKALVVDNTRPLVHLCARPGRITAEQLAAAVGGRVAQYSPCGVYLAEGDPGEVEALARGLAHVQDEGSQLVALALTQAVVTGLGETGLGETRLGETRLGKDERWLDLCAGPGGKAALLGCLAEQAGAEVTAVEIAEHRARLVRQAVTGLPVEVLCADGRDVGRHDSLPAGGFDRVLVDAPCTGLGSLRRRPEARWRRQPGDLPPLTRLQRELLSAAVAALRPGGVVAYVTCSPLRAETQVSVAQVLRRAGADSGLTLVDARPSLPVNLPQLGEGPTVQLWPHRHGTDAMFLALLQLRRDA